MTGEYHLSDRSKVSRKGVFRPGNDILDASTSRRSSVMNAWTFCVWEEDDEIRRSALAVGWDRVSVISTGNDKSSSAVALKLSASRWY